MERIVDHIRHGDIHFLYQSSMDFGQVWNLTQGQINYELRITVTNKDVCPTETDYKPQAARHIKRCTYRESITNYELRFTVTNKDVCTTETDYKPQAARHIKICPYR